MKHAFLSRCGLGVCLAAILFSLVGCASSVSTELTPAEKKNFSGSARPPEANEMMQKSIEEFRKKHPVGSGGSQPMPGN